MYIICNWFDWEKKENGKTKIKKKLYKNLTLQVVGLFRYPLHLQHSQLEVSLSFLVEDQLHGIYMLNWVGGFSSTSTFFFLFKNTLLLVSWLFKNFLFLFFTDFLFFSLQFPYIFFTQFIHFKETSKGKTYFYIIYLPIKFIKISVYYKILTIVEHANYFFLDFKHAKIIEIN